MNCPHCGKALPSKARAKTQARPIDTAAMTPDQLFAHYKATAPLEDVRFWIRTAKASPELRSAFVALESWIETSKPARADVYRELRTLQDQWREERYWIRVVVPAERIERRKMRAQLRQLRALEHKYQRATVDNLTSEVRV